MKKNIQHASIIRLLFTVVSMPLLRYIPWIDSRLLLFGTIWVLDVMDKNTHECPESCALTWEYQLNDKLNDTFAYYYAYALFPLDTGYLYFLIYRTIGVVLFIATRQSIWLVLFFDALKEYLIYRFLFQKTNLFIPIILAIVLIKEITLYNEKKHVNC
jgi:hypothetical protein